jgi:Mn2+/Fe2+ NRAMP family transporter
MLDGPGEWRAAGSGCRPPVRVARALVPLAAALIAVGCASPSTSYNDYRGKVQQTAVAMISFPVIVVANDREYMGKHVNKLWVNLLAMLVFCALVVVSVATLPLLFWTKAGQ